MDTKDIIELIRRSPVLKALREEGFMDRRELEQHLGVSKSTVHRFTRSLRDNGLIERSDDGFTLTALGEASAKEVTAFETSIETAWKLAPLLASEQYTHMTFDLEALADATIVEATSSDPIAPVQRGVEILSAGEQVRVFTETITGPSLETNWRATVHGTQSFEIVFTLDVFEVIISHTEMAQQLTEMLETDRVKAYIYDGEIPFVTGTADGTVAIGVNDEKGHPLMLIETDNKRVLSWAESMFESYRESSRPVNPSQLETSSRDPIQ